MVKGFIIALIALVSFDMALRHGAGTSAAVEFMAHAVDSTIAAGRDSIFSH
jgi:hypothetical protein